MAKAGSSWRVSIFRPGEDPIGHLATALAPPDVIGATDATLVATGRVLIDAALRRGTRGLIDAVQLARIPPEDNLLVVVDQFEELFRFERSRQSPRARDEAIAFVKLLLDATGAVYVTEHDSNQVMKLPSGSNIPAVLPLTGLNTPLGVTADGTGSVYVADRGNDMVVKLVS